MNAIELLKTIDHANPQDIVNKIYDARAILGAVLIELNTAWINENRYGYYDPANDIYSIKAKDDQDFVNKAFKKAKGRNIIYVQSNFWGIVKIEVDDSYNCPVS